MEDIKFDFNNMEYIFFIKIDEKDLNIGIIEIDKVETITLNEIEKEKYINNIISMDYDILYKMEKKINPKTLVRIIKYMNESTYIYCDKKERKDFLEQNIKRNNYKIKVVWKIKI